MFCTLASSVEHFISKNHFRFEYPRRVLLGYSLINIQTPSAKSHRKRRIEITERSRSIFHLIKVLSTCSTFCRVEHLLELEGECYSSTRRKNSQRRLLTHTRRDWSKWLGVETAFLVLSVNVVYLVYVWSYVVGTRRVSLGYTLKDIPTPSAYSYAKRLIEMTQRSSSILNLPGNFLFTFSTFCRTSLKLCPMCVH